MTKETIIKTQAVVKEILPNTRFIVELDNGHKVNAYTCGKMRKNYIKIILGDKVDIEISSYDINSCRITYRHK